MEGRGLHTGRTCSVRFERAPGPTTFGCGDDRAPLGALVVEGRERCSVAVLPSGREIATVEHLLSAIVGASVFAGLRVDVEGDEVPLFDGGSRAFSDALAEFPAAGPEVVVARAETFDSEGTILSVAPSAHTSIAVNVAFPAARFGRELQGSASWRGDRESYRASIATARTFGAAAELAALRARGLATHIPEGSVVALDLDDARYAPTDPAEPIRHKLLDALGDLATLGGRVRGCVEISRPSHVGTRRALRLAIEAGVFLSPARN